MLTMESNRITPTLTYQVEVLKSRNKELDLHRMVIEKKLDKALEQQATYQFMMKDLE